MKKHNLQNKKLDQIASNLFKAASVNDDDIEKIVAKPQLFASIEAEIKTAERKLQIKQNPSLVSLDWIKSSFINHPLALSAFAVLAILIISVTVITTGNQASIQPTQEIVKKEIQPKVVQIENSIIPSDADEEEDSVNDKQIAVKRENRETRKYVRKINWEKPPKVSEKKSGKSDRVQKPKIEKINSPQVSEKETQKVFYSLPFNENRATENEDLQIVSTELSNSELFNLGVNVQLENEEAKVKTELLIGIDGTARALRFVKEY